MGCIVVSNEEVPVQNNVVGELIVKGDGVKDELVRKSVEEMLSELLDQEADMMVCFYVIYARRSL